MSVTPPIAELDVVTGRLAWAQAGEYDAIDDRAVIAALAGRVARLVQAPTLAAAGGLNVQVGQWLAVIDCGDGTNSVARQRMSETFEETAGGTAARTDVIFAEIDLVAATWELKLYSEAETAGKLGVRLGTIGVPAGASQASAMTFTPAAATSAWATPDWPRGAVRVASATGSGANQTGSGFATASTYATTNAYTLVAGRRYRIRCTATVLQANYGSGNGVMWVSIGRTAGGSTSELGSAFQHPTKASGVNRAAWAEFVGTCPADIPAGSASFSARVWGGTGVNYFSTTGRWTTTLEDLGGGF